MSAHTDQAQSAQAPATRTWSVPIRRGTVQAVLVSLLAIGALQVLHRHQAEAHELPLLLHWLRDAALALPLALAAVAAASASRRWTAWSSALVGGGVFALLSAPAGQVHERLFVAEHAHEGSGGLAHAAADGMSAWLLVAAALLVVRGLYAVRWSPPRLRRPLAVSMTTALTAALALPAGLVVTAAPASAAAPTCPGATRSYDVAAINLDIPYNRWGTNTTTGRTNLDADGMMYVLQQDKAAVKNWDVPLGKKRDTTSPTGYADLAPGEPEVAGGRRLRPRPLMLRANIGDCVQVTLTNELNERQFGGQLINPRASMHVHGASFDVQTSDGSAVGFNADSTIARGDFKTYDFVAPEQEGAYLFHDHGAIAGSEGDGGSTVHGLFGALAVEPAGSSWFDPVSGARLDLDPAKPYTAVAGQSGELYVDAVIMPPLPAVSFRESIQLGHDEIPGIGFGFNYGSEPGARREEKLCGDCVGEETSLSSWTYGDPALVKLASGKGPWLPTDGQSAEDCGLPVSCYTSNVTHAYVKDPIKFRYGLAGVKETHVFHMHAHQWLVEPGDNAPVGTPDDPNGNLESTKVDSQTFGPGDMFTAELIGGAGSLPGTVGDTIFHCHLYPHFAEGFWSLFRVHDVYEDGTGRTPDGIIVAALKALPDRAPLKDPTPTSPGYPRFIPGQPGWRAPQPYLGISEANGQTDVPATVAREDLTQAKRIVAGRYLDPAILDKTQRVTSTSGGSVEVQQISNDSAPRAEMQEITVDATGGSFTIAGDPELLPWNASDLAVETVVERVSGKAVTLVPVSPVPPAGRQVWAFRFDVPGDVPDLTVNGALLTRPGPDDTSSGTPVPTTVPGSASVRIEQGAGGGTFTVMLGASTSVPLPFDASALQVRDALAGMTPTVAAAVTKPAGQRWTITYSGPGDVAELVVNGSGLTTGTATVSTITPGTGPGSFTLTFGAKTTAPIAHGAAAAQVKAALEALSTVDDVGGVEVTGTDPYDVKLLRWSRTDSLVLTASGATVTRDSGFEGATAADTTRIAHGAHALMVEKGALTAAHQARGTGTAPQPGAPFVDPCPSGRRTVTYNVSVIQRDVVYNEAGWHDTQGRLYVLDKDVEAVMAGTKEPEPLFIRVNAGDCINFNLTSYLPNWIGGDAFINLAQTNMVGGHIHLVKFDVTASDGSSNGWNYQEAAFTKDQMDFNAQTDADQTGKACTQAPGGCILPTPTTWNPSNVPNKRGQTIHERWYADSELRTVFTHDHHFPAMMQNRGQYGALVVEPAGTKMRNPFSGARYEPGNTCSTTCVGEAVGTHMDILGPGANDDFREFGLSFQDFVSLTKKGGDPTLTADTFNAPATPEAFPNEDPGVMGINYRNAPFQLRDTKNGVAVDPAYRMSSTVFGDPKTPLLQAYAGDKVRIRLIQGSQEEQNVWALHGMRWREEPDDPQSPLVNSKALGISDAANFEIPPLACSATEDCKGDFMYSSTSTDATYLGMWGVMRVYGKGVSALLPLPDNTPQAVNGNVTQTVTGLPPDPVPAGKRGGEVCPTPNKSFDVFATDGRITYNKAGDHDPYGLMYGVVEPGETPDQAVARVRQEQRPMVLRANEGDCLSVTLTNRIDPNGPFATQHAAAGASDGPYGGDPKLTLEPPTGTRAGLRVSLHPQLVRYDVRYSDGATVGFNRDQTVGPNQSITYRWWADDITPAGAAAPGELGATNLVDFGDVRGHRHHGLFAGLVVEPKGASYHDQVTGEPVVSGASADIRVPGAADFREDVPFFQDGLNLRTATGAAILPPADAAHPGVTLDAEDDGEKGFNYRSPRFVHRGDPLHELPTAAATTATNPIDGGALSSVFSSKVHGDPETPVFRAYAGDPVRVRVLQGSDKPRQHSFQLSGHSWRSQADDPGSNRVGTTGGMSVSRTLNVHLDAAGGSVGAAGDYRYNCGVSFHHQSGGLWGIQRVYAPPPAGRFTPSQLTPSSDDPTRLGYRPILPLEHRTVAAVVYDDSNRNRLRGADEKVRAGVPVELHTGNSDGTTGALLETRTTDAQGRVVFTTVPAAYDLVVPAVADFAATTPATMRLTATKDGPAQSADFGQVQLANLAVRPFNDQNGNLVADPGEAVMEGWNVTLTGEGRTASAAVTTGAAAFGDLLPGSYSATVTPAAGYFSTTHKAMPVSIAVAENADLTGASDIRVGYALKAGVSVRVFNDSNGNGSQELGESSLSGRRLDAKGGAEAAVLATTTTDAAGNATLDDPDPLIDGLVPGAYDVTSTVPTDWALGQASRVVTRADGTTAPREALAATGSAVRLGVQEKTSQVVTLPQRNPKGWVSAVPFNDLNNDGVRQDKEGKLVGWHADLFLNGVYQASTSTDNGGRATWYVGQAGPVETPVGYTVRMSPQEVTSTEIPWTATSSGSVTVGAVSGEDRAASFGFVQLGTIQALAWHDLDRDGIDSGRGEVLANRTVRLYDAGGKALLQQKVTDAGGMASFKASAGIDYQLEVLLPTGWTATAPFASNGSPATKLKVMGPSGLASVLTRFGQYNTNDRTPPPDPVQTAAVGTNGARTVTLSSEAGASFRYTLDGDLPSTTTGMAYTGPVTLSTSTGKTLKAVAIDAAGNASGVSEVSYTITGGTTAAAAAPGSWTPSTGTTRGVLADLAFKDDGRRFFLTSAASGSSYVTDGYGTYVVPQAQRTLLGLGVAFEGRVDLAGVNRSLEMYNWATKKYEVVRAAEAQGLTDSRTLVDVAGDPKRFMNATTGEIRLKVRASAASRNFELGADQVSVTVRY